jgi:hypothetical protein
MAAPKKKAKECKVQGKKVDAVTGRCTKVYKNKGEIHAIQSKFQSYYKTVGGKKYLTKEGKEAIREAHPGVYAHGTNSKGPHQPDAGLYPHITKKSDGSFVFTNPSKAAKAHPNPFGGSKAPPFQNKPKSPKSSPRTGAAAKPTQQPKSPTPSPRTQRKNRALAEEILMSESPPGSLQELVQALKERGV